MAISYLRWLFSPWSTFCAWIQAAWSHECLFRQSLQVSFIIYMCVNSNNRPKVRVARRELCNEIWIRLLVALSINKIIYIMFQIWFIQIEHDAQFVFRAMGSRLIELIELILICHDSHLPEGRHLQRSASISGLILSHKPGLALRTLKRSKQYRFLSNSENGCTWLNRCFSFQLFHRSWPCDCKRDPPGISSLIDAYVDDPRISS